MSATEAIRTSGTVKWFSSKKGFGFVQCADGQDAFVHYTEIRMRGYKTLDEGMQVTFELHKSEKGLSAHNVQHVDSFGIVKG